MSEESSVDKDTNNDKSICDDKGISCYFDNYFLVILEDDISEFFALTLFALFAFSLIAVVRKGKEAGAIHHYMPNTLPMIGVIGTFLGIYIGLIDFNLKEINNSITSLLNGLKIAFSSSIIGLSLSLILRLVYSWRIGNSEKEASSEKIEKLLEKLSEITSEGDSKQKELLAKIASSISGETESSVVGQLKSFRDENLDSNQRLKSSINNGFDELKSELRNFSQKVSEDSSSVLIKALDDLIRDFNDNLTSQFGENFKQLNDSVGQLVVWQDNYKQHIEKLSGQFDDNKECLVEIEESLRKSETNMRNVSSTMKELEDIIRFADKEVEMLSSHLENLSTVHEKANSTLPMIESKVNELTEGLTSSVSSSTKAVSESIVEQQKAMVDFLSSFRETYESGINETSTSLVSSFEKFDSDMQKEVERVIELMGSHLTALSQKLVDDYNPLVSELRQLLILARKIDQS